MNYNNEILQELEVLAPALIPLQKVQVYSLPAGYFAEFSGNVMEGIREQSAVSSGQWADGIVPEHGTLPPPISTLTVPEGFFQNFAASVLQKIKVGEPSVADEIKELSPALLATGNDNVFTVPNSYFKNLPDIIVGQLRQPARVVAMKPRSSFARYAAAAVFTGLLGLATFSVFNNKSDSDTVNVTSLAMAEAKNIIQTNSFDRVLETVSDEDIVGFLQSGGQDVEAALVASSVDSKELPAADEYITNENTLNNYLESLDITYPN